MSYPTCFTQILGNDEIKRQLNHMVSQKTIGHALLFAGVEGIGKSLFALALAARVMSEYEGNDKHISKLKMGQHPDVHIYRPEGKLALHSMQAMRQLSEEVHFPPYEAGWKVFIIHEADRMLTYSANALLKTFEEPPTRTLIILLSHSQSSLLQTIVSRCRTLRFQPLSPETIKAYLKSHYRFEEDVYEKIARQAQGSLGHAVRLVENRSNEIRLLLLNLLAQGIIGSYRELENAVNVLNEHIEQLKKQTEKAGAEILSQALSDQRSAQQQHFLEKEIEGLSALTLSKESQGIFEVILSWYRDLHHLALGGSPYDCFNADFLDQLQQNVQRGHLQTYQQILQAVEEAHLAMQRSTSFSLCMENLFLKLRCLG